MSSLTCFMSQTNPAPIIHHINFVHNLWCKWYSCLLKKKKKKKKILTYPLGFTVLPFYPQNVQLSFMIA